MAAGLGSSASAGIAALRAFSKRAGTISSNSQLCDRSIKLERRFHGSPSGVDSCVIVHESALVFSRSTPCSFAFESLTRKSSGDAWNFLLINSQESGRTQAMIEYARPYFTGTERARQVLNEFEDKTRQGVMAFEQYDLEAFTDAMQVTGRHLVSAGLTTPRTAQIIDVAVKLGFKGVKITGAGGGGCILAVIPNDKPLKYYQVQAENAFGAQNVYQISYP